MTEVIVIGGGVIGLLAAWRLAQEGRSVSLYDRGEPGQEASAAALGVLAAQASPHYPAEFLRLRQDSLALYPALALELKEVTGLDVEWRDEGLLYVGRDEAGLAWLAGELAVQQAAGVPVRLLDGREAQTAEPALGPAVAGALHFRNAAQVDNRRLGRALALAAAQAGVAIHAGRPVTGLLRAPDGRVNGVRAGLERIGAGVVVLAAGSWSGHLLEPPLLVRPAKGQALALRATAPLRHILDDGEVYVVPRRDGRLLVGATVEEAGFDRRVTAGGVAWLLAGATRLLPALGDAAMVGCWAGLRPRPADDAPLLGPMESHPGLIVATGHFRNGILLAPITARLVTDWAAGRPTPPYVARFAPERFE